MAPYTGEGLGGLSTEHAVTLTVRDSAALLDATAGPGPGRPYAAPPPALPFLARRHAARAPPDRVDRAARRTARPSIPRASRSSERPSPSAAELGHEVTEADPGYRARGRGPDLPDARGRQLRGQRPESSDRGPATSPWRGRERHLRHRGARGEDRRPGLRPGDPDRPPARPPDGRVPPAPRRAAHPRAGHAGRGQARVDRHDARGRGRVLAAGICVLSVHRLVQYHGPARHGPADRPGRDGRGAPKGLPLAVQLVARFGDEATLFRLAAQLEAARPWFDRKPILAG